MKRITIVLILLLVVVMCSTSFGAIALEGSDSTSAASVKLIVQSTFTGANRVWVAIWACEASGHLIPDSMSFGYRGDQATEALKNGKTVGVADSIASTSSGFMQGIGIAYIKESDVSSRNSDTVLVWTTGSESSTKMFLWSGVFSDIDQTVLVNDSVSNATASSTPNPLTQSITRANVGVVIAGYTEGTGATWTWNNSFTEDLDFLYNGASLTVGYLITSTGTSTTISATASAQNRAALVGLSFDEDGVGGGGWQGQMVPITIQ